MFCFGFSKSKAKTAVQTTSSNKMQKENTGKGAEISDGEPEIELDQQSIDSDTSSPRRIQGEPEKLFTNDENKEDKLVAVVVTIFEGASYDENFRQMQPQTVPGERVSTYSVGCCDVGRLLDLLAGTQEVPQAPSAWHDLMEDIRSVPSDSVTLNWECCAGCSDSGFPLCGASRPSRVQGGGFFRRAAQRSVAASPTMQLMGLAVRRGYTVMCSDFSLKALIAEWSEEHLGPNPFVKMEDECDQQFQLDFLPEELQNEEVPQQLQVVGELCSEQGKAIVSALGGTIVYTVNPRRARTDLYELKVLTVVSSWAGGRGSFPEAMKCSIGAGDAEKRGAAGHVTLTYASGGQLLTSMGHWIELTRIDTSLESVIQVAARNFGQDDLRRLNAEVEGLSSQAERQECLQRWSKEMVQKSVPTRMKYRTKYQC
eukprot:TRINITY_DN11516_c0_g2_i1.p1 TRINITY_DN11516_c0_g2~~TRINITY_DN11516_c0_g2_i1.p1  ORF type:complete len:427 (-),score=76.77 TRINITY_DN11516_c0_g2_i1:116-1396(-)